MAIQDLLKDKNEQIDYGSICKKYSWILEKNHCCVLSPDSDGLLCGLFMSKSLVWKIVGFYDGKVSVINKEYLIIDLYQNGKKGSRGIGRIYGVNEYHILKMLREWNIPIRGSYKKKIDNKEKNNSIYEKLSPEIRERMRINTEINNRLIKYYGNRRLTYYDKDSIMENIF